MTGVNILKGYSDVALILVVVQQDDPGLLHLRAFDWNHMSNCLLGLYLWSGDLAFLGLSFLMGNMDKELTSPLV